MTTEPTTTAHSSKLLLLAAICMLLLGIWVAFWAESAQEIAQPRPQPPELSVVDIADLFIHPLCLDRAEEIRQGAGFWCDPALETIEVAGRQGRARTWYWVDRPRADEAWSNGSIGFRLAKQWSEEQDSIEYAVLEVSDHGGGSGRFARIEVFERRADDRYRVLHRIHAGDRCNDGYAELVRIDDDTIVYRTAATAFRLLNPIDRTNWRMVNLITTFAGKDDKDIEIPATLLGWQPYSDIANCAICCAGTVVHRHDLNGGGDEVISVEVYENAFIHQTKVDSINACLHEWSEGREWGSRGSIEIGEWKEELVRLGVLCGQDQRDADRDDYSPLH